MRILCTGSSGFIGRRLTARLSEDGHLVERVVRSVPRQGEARFDLPGRTLDASRLSGGSLEGVDAVIHLAGEPIFGARWTATKKEAIRASRILTGSILSTACASLERPPAVFLTGSAIGIYGDRGEEELTEKSAAGSGFLADVCRSWEAAAEPAAAAGIRVAALRTGVVLGPGGGSLSVQLPLFRAGLGGRLGSGRQWMSFISLEDEVAAILHVLGNDTISGPVNLTAPAPVRNADFTRTLALVVAKPGRLAVPRFAMRGLLGADLAEEMLLASQRVLPRVLTDTGFVFALAGLRETLEVATRRG
jgi:uncharacterized protein (TIGR01777 family)